MKILLTGATGFLGSHLLKAMLRAGYEIAIIKRATSDLGRIAEVEGKYDSFDVPETELTQIFRNIRLIWCAIVPQHMAEVKWKPLGLWMGICVSQSNYWKTQCKTAASILLTRIRFFASNFPIGWNEMSLFICRNIH